MKHYRPIKRAQHLVLAANTVVDAVVPRRARVARVFPRGNVVYTLGGTDPSDTVGFPLTGGSAHDIRVGGAAAIKFWERGGATTVHVQYFGGDVSPVVPRVAGAHGHVSMANNNVVTLAVPARSTKMLLYGSRIFAYTLDGSDPSSTQGIQVAATTYAVVDCYRAALKVRRRSGNATTLGYQAFENWGEVFYSPIGAHVNTLLGAGVQSAETPGRATVCRLYVSGSKIYYSVDGVDPTAVNSLEVASDTTVDIPVAPGTVLKVLRSAATSRVNRQFLGE